MITPGETQTMNRKVGDYSCSSVLAGYCDYHVHLWIAAMT